MPIGEDANETIECISCEEEIYEGEGCLCIACFEAQSKEVREKIKRLEAENVELRAHIERWAELSDNPDDHVHGTVCPDSGKAHEFCYTFDVARPCPSEVARGRNE